MVFNTGSVSLILSIAALLWLAIISVIFQRLMKRYNRLVRGVAKTGLTDVLDSIITTQNTIKKHAGLLEGSVSKLEKDAQLHIQRVGIVRFNPFSDTGGSQSFSLSLLDSNDNGIVMTSLHTRTGNRWYIKKIHEGKGVGFELSKEEESAIKTASPVQDIRDI